MSLLFEILSYIFDSFGQDHSLDTRKIDQHIKELNNYPWFKVIYDDEKYHKLFFVNREVRKYLQSKFRVKRIIKSKQAQMKFIKFLQLQTIKGGRKGEI
ncbi:hypothetical protein [Neobacillus mesonae]|uniref:hypothetical protein n=1 Tax=Neobacillus mesonae TaxID=1193713 RepID=UPI000834ACEC|nr:hypothetical protein [Neobacillus mesonae]